MKEKKNLKILVTGAAGFIGSKICKKLIENRYIVIAIDDLSNGKKKNIPLGVKFLKLDLSRKASINKIPKCDIIFHLAGQSSGEKSFDSPIVDLEKNTISTLNMIEYGIKNKCRKIIYASSMSVYGEPSDKSLNEESQTYPISCYGISKITSEKYIKIFSKKLPYIIFRMFNVYGSGQNMKDLRQGMVSIYLSQALSGDKIKVKGSLNRRRDFIHVDDVTNIWMKTIKTRKINKIYNLSSGNNHKVKDLLKKILKLTGKKKILKLTGTIGDQFNSYSNNFQITKDFEYKKFISLDQGLKKFYNSEKNK
jgi:UDP-glucose 4-epimerase